MGITLLCATSNTAKLNTMREALKGTGIELKGLSDMPGVPPVVEENGNSPLENACIKAMVYYKHYRIPLFSLDSGLYIEQLPEELQPGIHVRNINGKYLTDEEMTEYYGGLAKKYGRLTAQYLNAICLVMSDTEIYEHMGEDISGNKFYITDVPHSKKVDGYPLDRISLHIPSGKYYYDLTPEDKQLDETFADGFVNFFVKALNIKE